MNDRPTGKLFFNMEIVDDYGRVHGRLRREIPRDAAFMGTRIVEEMQLGVLTGPQGPFAAAVELMKVKEFRRKLLIEAARTGGHALADHLEDREGWHGLDRQDSVERRYTER